MKVRAPPTRPAPGDPQVLIKEARRLQRRRRIRIGVATLLVGGATAVAAAAVRDVSGSPPAGRTVTRGPGTPPRRSRQPSATSEPAGAVSAMGLTTTSKGWADTCEGLYLTGDDGGRWTDVTPPNLAHVSCVSEHIGTVRTLGTSDLWVSAIDVPWLNVGDCGGCVDPPGSALDSTTDGGTSWHSTGSCGALGCAFTEMNFVNPRQGIGSDGYVESTDDGGRTWTLVGYGPKNSLGPIELAPDGRMWEVIGDESTNPPQERIATLTGVGSCGCGRVPATEIGSSPVELGSVAPYGEPPTVAALPTFFGAKGVLLARLIDPTRPLDTLVIYTTADGGNRWTEHRGPVGADLDSFPDNGQFDVPFSAYGPTRWVLNVGRRTFETTDSGRHWSATASRGLRGALVWSASFVSATSGWSLAEERSCAAGVCTFVPHLYSTTDSGRRWLSISPP